MKILIHSNGPTARTGYGVQVALLVDRLCNDGHQVAVSANWPQSSGITEWRSPSGHTIPVYPPFTGREALPEHAMHFFDGDPRGGWIITLLDVWGIALGHLTDFNVVAWTPVDHHPVPPHTTRWLEQAQAIPVAMSRHGQSELDSEYIPLAVDTAVYKPTFVASDGKTTARQLIRVPPDAFVVGMVGMNKDPMDRKGFNEAFRGFAAFQRNHRNAVLFVHSDYTGEGMSFNLIDLARACGIPESSIVFSQNYPYKLGGFRDPSFMAAVYTAMDVLLAPSAGEGFCVPLIEAQACGTPVIVSNFTAQPELVGAGWIVDGQLQYDGASRADYFRASITDVAAKLEEAYNADLIGMQERAREFAKSYDADYVYATYWRRFLAGLDSTPPADKPVMKSVDVIVPFMRPENYRRLRDSFDATAPATATLWVVSDNGNLPDADDNAKLCTGQDSTTYAVKVNLAVKQTTADWILVVGDDVEFTPGWFEAAQKLSDRYDVIGTNDSEPGRVRNPDVANGSHADHFFVRRSYIEDVGACLDGPGILAPEAYYHWFTDKEIIQLAKARGVYSPCLESVIIHHHPGFDGREDLRNADVAYARAVTHSASDQITFRKRAPLIERHKVVRGGIW